ncbi:FAD-binding domain-containing protein [Lyngbya confervoides]|uniref:Deoxyribodipyrimidine photo-lyase n=1 Tax=Lyngbya confervoides BDU141951 TaxID=1574623 RepID=A0ABD4T5L9_9CYAN|nr:FAD-binding domain-containing protein [Lyngbya confervoides]MCM1983827.1 deoxyribodipyrimidine photo-lyase [Lyngbya confervoides BDU141951]
MSDRILFWHRRDLRLADNLGLTAACQRTRQVTGVFCLDPAILNREDLAPARLVFLLDSLRELQAGYARLGSDLLILHQSPVTGLPALAKALKVRSVFWNQDVEPYGRRRDEQVAAGLKEQGIAVQQIWDQLLHPPGTILTGSGSPYTVYGPFWKNWRAQPKQDPVPAPPALQGHTETEETLGTIALPDPQTFQVIWTNPLEIPVGEAAARQQLDQFCQGTTIGQYDEDRNYPARPGTSRLSAALKFGTLGIRTVWRQAEQVLVRCRSDEERNGVEVWQKELAWREFYQHVLYFFPALADGPYRPVWKGFPWRENRDQFAAWCAGMTGYPIVDAAMRQLNQTGWMHNRCRMIVASFLTKDLILNWQWGEKYFMQQLCDGDLAANNGGWQWSASSGMDPKPLRIFNPASQAQKFDPEADYIRQWIPELKSVDSERLVKGNLPKAVRDRVGYPDPIVNHQQQQQTFKRLYQQQKNAINPK